MKEWEMKLRLVLDQKRLQRNFLMISSCWRAVVSLAFSSFSLPSLSTSCPLPGFNETAKDNSKLKTLSINELFESKITKASGQEISEKNEKKKLESLTNDLRKMLNLH